jgi:RNA polymerase sigma-B factor
MRTAPTPGPRAKVHPDAGAGNGRAPTLKINRTGPETIRSTNGGTIVHKEISGLDTDELLLRYRDTRDAEIQEELMRRFEPLARRLARRYHSGGEPLEDLVQVATIGLLSAISKFDPERGFAFTSYATPTILGELKRYFRDTGWALHVPRGIKERALELSAETEKLSLRLGRSPSVGELAGALGISEEETLDAIEAYHGRYATPLDESPEDDERPGPRTQTLGSEDEQLEVAEYLAVIAQGVDALSDTERMALFLRFARDMTQAEIADRIGVSQMQVSRLLRGAIDKLRAAADEPTVGWAT